MTSTDLGAGDRLGRRPSPLRSRAGNAGLAARWLLGLLPLLPAGGALADASPRSDRGAAEIFDSVTVVAGRCEQRLGEIAGTVSITPRAELDRRQVQSLDDLVRYEPGVTSTGAPGRFGTEGLRIRGIGGNRVGIELDGMPIGDGFAVGSFSNAGRDRVEPELLRSVEILRGPASALYGSDALAGVVVLTTRQPADLLTAGRDMAVELRGGADGRDHGLRASAIGAVARQRWSALALVARREANELDNVGEIRPDPARRLRESGFLRLARGFDRSILDLVIELQQEHAETNVRHLVGGPAQYATTERLTADDRAHRTRAALAYSIASESAWLTSGEARLFRGDADYEQRTAQWRRPDARTPDPSLRDRLFSYEERQSGAAWIGQSAIGHGDALHRLTWGAEIDSMRLIERRTGSETNLTTGASTSLVLGEHLPVRDFPISRARRLGLFASGDVALDDGRWRLQPALRYDRSSTRADPDAVYREDFPHTAVVDSDHHAITGKLGVTRSLGAARLHQVYLQIAEGFRSPPVYDLNIGLLIAQFNYEAIPNPDLRPERSRGVEAGWRFGTPRLSLQLALFDNRYRDLIDSRVNLGVDPATGTTIFQSLNRDRARIRGVEGRMRVDLGQWSRAWRGWTLDAALAAARGDDTRRRLPLNSVDPPRMTLGAAWISPTGRWSASAASIWTAAQNRLDRSATDLFGPPASRVLDLYGRLAGGTGWTIDVALLNATGEKVWSYGKVRGVRAGDPQLDLYTEPGRSLSVSFSVKR